MASIYKVWMMNYRPAWYALSKTAQDELSGKIFASAEKVGGKLLLTATSLWAHEKWAAWGIEQYPNIEAVMQHAQTIWDVQWLRYVKTWTTLGVLMEPATEVVIPKAAVYELAFVNLNEAWYRLSEAQKADWMAKHAELFKQFGVQAVMMCNSIWCSEGYLEWILEAYPSHEAVMGLRLATFEAGWYQYVGATSLLGVKWPLE